MSQLNRPVGRGWILPSSTSCPIQPPSRFHDAHPHWGGQSALLSPLIQMLISSGNTLTDTLIKNVQSGASLVVQLLRIRLLMQGTRVRALVWEDPTCCGTTGPVSHNC